MPPSTRSAMESRSGTDESEVLKSICPSIEVLSWRKVSAAVHNVWASGGLHGVTDRYDVSIFEVSSLRASEDAEEGKRECD